MLRWLVHLSDSIFYFLRLFNFCLLIFLSFMLCYHIRWWNKVVYTTRFVLNAKRLTHLSGIITLCSEVSVVNSPGNSCSQSRRRKGRLRLKGFAVDVRRRMLTDILFPTFCFHRHAPAQHEHWLIGIGCHTATAAALKASHTFRQVRV